MRRTRIHQWTVIFLLVTMAGFAENITGWNNAILGGSGITTGVISGNLKVHGSIHLLGDAVTAGNAAFSFVNGFVNNNYSGVEDDMLARVPSCPTVSFGGENVQSLSAKVRVRKGLVSLGNTSYIGEANVPGDSDKETVDGTYNTTGWTGTGVTPDGGRGDPTVVYSDNGWDNGYDIGPSVTLPLMTDVWYDALTGEKVWDTARNSWYTYSNYYKEVLVGTEASLTDGMVLSTAQTWVTGKSGTRLYYNADTDAKTTTFPSPAPPLTQDWLWVDGVTGTMKINGNIYLGSTLTTSGSFTYLGRGTILAQGNVTLNGNFVPPAGVVSFPVTNCLGLMTASNMTVGSGSQQKFMGAFYAQGTITSNKQLFMGGTYMASYFSAGTMYLPEIFQVPSLVDNLPASVPTDHGGMIGNYNWAAPTIVTQPCGAIVECGEDVLLSTAATATGTLYYQWVKDGFAMSGKTESTCGIIDVVTTDSGTYFCSVYTQAALTKTDAVSLIVEGPPVLMLSAKRN